MPKVPLSNTPLTFVDYLPKDLTAKKSLDIVTQLCLKLHPSQYIKPYHYRLENNTLESTFGRVSLSTRNKGFDTLLYDNFELKIKDLT